MAVKKQPFAMIREMTGHRTMSALTELQATSSPPSLSRASLAWPSPRSPSVASSPSSSGSSRPFRRHTGRCWEAKLLKSNEFSFYLNTDSNRPSALLWGGVDRDLFEGSIASRRSFRSKTRLPGDVPGREAALLAGRLES